MKFSPHIVTEFHRKFRFNLTQTKLQKAGPLEAILVIFGRSFLNLLFCLKGLEKR